ncbi:MAG TPA: hypothetical protein PLK37_12895 [Terricaulis sp.]|nr:hypothetical protein [Terricaulis sp.]
MQTPKNLDEAKALVKSEKAKLTTAFSTAIGSRWLLAIAAAFALAFASHTIYAPSRLPPVGGLNMAAIGLPPLDLGIVGEQAAKARDAAVAQGAPSYIQAKINENRQYVPLMNAIGLGLALVVLAINLTVMTKRRRVTRG